MRAHQLDARRVRQPQVEHDQIDLAEIGADARQQLRGALDRDGLVAGVLQRRAETVADERRVVGDDDRLGRDRGAGHQENYRNTRNRTPWAALQVCA